MNTADPIINVVNTVVDVVIVLASVTIIYVMALIGMELLDTYFRRTGDEERNDDGI